MVIKIDAATRQNSELKITAAASTQSTERTDNDLTSNAQWPAGRGAAAPLASEKSAKSTKFGSVDKFEDCENMKNWWKKLKNCAENKRWEINQIDFLIHFLNLFL